MRSMAVRWLVWFSATAACGELPVAGLEAPWDDALGREADRVNDSTCEVFGEASLQNNITVAAEDDTEITGIVVVNVPATTTIGPEDERDLPPRTEVYAPLAFKGRVQDHATYFTGTAIEIGDGLVQLDPGVIVGRPFSTGHLVRGLVELDSETIIQDIDIPCQALTLDRNAGRDVAPSTVSFGSFDDETDEAESLWRVVTERCSSVWTSPLDWRARFQRSPGAGLEGWRGDIEELDTPKTCVIEMTLRNEPDNGIGVTVLSSWVIVVTVIGRVGDFVKVQATYPGATLSGWLPAAQIEPIEKRPIEYGRWARCGGGGFFGGGRRRTRTVPVYTGLASVRPGAHVYAREDESSRWAIVTETNQFMVRHTLSSKWVRLVKAGIWETGSEVRRGSGLYQAYVPADAVDLPERWRYSDM